MKEKEFNHPETKSFNEQYGQLMAEELQRRREEQEARERAWAEEAGTEYDEPAFEDSLNADYDMPETDFLDENGKVDFSAIIEAEDWEDEAVENEFSEASKEVSLEEDLPASSLENEYVEADYSEVDYPEEAFPEGDDPEGDDYEDDAAADGAGGGEKPPVYVDEKTLRRRRKRKIRRISRLAVLILVIVALVLVGIANTPLFAIKKIEVEGAHEHSKKYVVRHSGINVGDNLFRIKYGKAAKSLEESPYIYAAKVKRKLPDTVVIEVTERVPIAYFPYGSKYIVIDKRGTVIKVRNTEPSLTRMEGFKITDRTVGSTIGVKEQSKLKDCMEILRAMKANDIFFKELEAGDVVMRAYVYDRLVCLGTKKNLKKSIEDGTLAQVLQDLYKKKTSKGTIHIGGENYISFSPKVSK